MNARPIADRVLIRPDAREKKTEGGVIIPDTTEDTSKSRTGVVVAIGIGRPGEPAQVKEGDRVVYGAYSGAEMLVDGESLMLMRESDIYAILVK